MKSNGNLRDGAASRAVFVTGTSSGIGRAAAIHLARKGYLVFASVQKTEDAEGLRRLGEERLIPLCPVDLRSREQVSAAARAVEEEVRARDLPGLYAIVNNAGGGQIAPLELADIDKLLAELETRILARRRACSLRKGPGRPPEDERRLRHQAHGS